MSTHLLRGTPEEKAQVEAVENMTGISIDDFLYQVATTDPMGKDGCCIFCHAKKHPATCRWLDLRARLGIGESQ
jgi:hypothetical protein